MSKQKQIWRALLSGERMTQESARKQFNHWRLADAVLRLRNKGVHVLTVLVGTTNHALYYVSRSERTKHKHLLRELELELG